MTMETMHTNTCAQLGEERTLCAYSIVGATRIFLELWDEVFVTGRAPLTTLTEIQAAIDEIKRYFARYENASQKLDEYYAQAAQQRLAPTPIDHFADKVIRQVEASLGAGGNSGRKTSEGAPGQVIVLPASGRPEECEHDWRGIDMGRMCCKCGLMQV